jgi:High potential iron-sulfur protein
MTGSNKISRRYVLTAAAEAAVGVVAGAAIVTSPMPAHAAKAPQKGVKYQDTPKGDQSCANCALFEPPSSCKTVDGTVSPDGWCMVYVKKPT